MGGLWGSFANVCIYRLPQDKGVVSGRSYCPKCKTQISWYDNIPILSYLFIQGKCRKCKKQISIQYLIVELLSVLSFVIVYFFYGITITTLLFIILALTFIVIFFIDLKHYIIPNGLTFPLMFIGFLLWVFGFVIEILADNQKKIFRKNPLNKGKFISSGLWAWSRHPNYFGEIILWLGIAIIALPSMKGGEFLGLISPLFVYVLLTKISGIPMLEKSSDNKWGLDDDYIKYKKTTPILFLKKPNSN